MTPVEKLINTATKEVGYLEKSSNSRLDNKTANAGSGNYTKYAKYLDGLKIYNGAKNGYSWCDVFVDWCFVSTFGVEIAMKMTCQPLTGGYGASCTQSSNYYKNAGRFYKNNPKVGDQIFFNDGKGGIIHTGIVVNVDSNKVYTIEGNTSSEKGVVKNGGSVNDKSYPINYNRIYGYGRPDYSLVEEDDEDMDVNRFKELWYEMRKELQDNDCATYSESAREWAISNGLILGNGTVENGEPNYMWDDILTRQQFVTMLWRFANLMGKA